MRSNVETRMCKACNAPLALRESCARCADKARARLHAEGKAGKERKSWQAYDNGSEVGRWFIPGFHSTFGVPLSEADKLIEDGALELVNSTPKHEPPPVGAEVSYEVALADMQRRPEARYENAVMYNRDTYRVRGVCLECLLYGAWSASSLHVDTLRSHRWVRLPDATTLPAIGAEVSWSEAKRDMQARKEARYRPTCSPGHEYAWASQLVLRELGGLWQSADWSEDVEGQLRWARLA